MFLVTWPLSRSEAGVTLCKCFTREQHYFHMKSSQICIKAKLTTASQVAKRTTVKCESQNQERVANFVLTISEDGPNVDPILPSQHFNLISWEYSLVSLSINLANESESPSKPINHTPMHKVFVVHDCKQVAGNTSRHVPRAWRERVKNPDVA